MKVEISKEQKAALGTKVSLCADFLKNEIQPHIVKGDVIAVSMGDYLDLYISHDKIHVKETKIYSFGIDIPLKRLFFLEKSDRKQAKKYICDAAPELAVEFLKNWENAKTALKKQVSDKMSKVDELDRFVEGFKL